MIHTARQSPKFIKLVRRLRALVPADSFASPESVAIALLERLWHATASGPIRGDIGSYDDEVIAEACGWPLDATDLIDLLVDCGWLDRDKTHRLLVHDWHQHAPRFVKGNVQKKGGFLTAKEGDAPEDGPIGEPHRPALEDPPQRMGVPNLTKPNQTQPNVVGRQSTGDESTDDDASASGGGRGFGEGSGSVIPPPDPQLVSSFGKRVGPPQSRRDQVLCWKLVAASSQLGEHWLNNIAEAVRTVQPRPDKPWAYARKVAADGSRECPGPGATGLRDLLARIRDPPDDWPKRGSRSD